MADTDEIPAPFDHDVHPRHAATGQFAPRGDVHQAMTRISDGRQARRDTLPQPAPMAHPEACGDTD